MAQFYQFNMDLFKEKFHESFDESPPQTEDEIYKILAADHIGDPFADKVNDIRNDCINLVYCYSTSYILSNSIDMYAAEELSDGTCKKYQLGDEILYGTTTDAVTYMEDKGYIVTNKTRIVG